MAPRVAGCHPVVGRIGYQACTSVCRSGQARRRSVHSWTGVAWVPSCLTAVVVGLSFVDLVLVYPCSAASGSLDFPGKSVADGSGEPAGQHRIRDPVTLL